MLAIDKLALAQKLRNRAGFSPEHAEAAAEAFAESIAGITDLATKTDIAPLATKAELAAAVSSLATKAELAAAVAPLATKAELAAAVAPLATKAELAEAKADILKWVFGAMVVNVITVLAAMFGLAKLLGH